MSATIDASIICQALHALISASSCSKCSLILPYILLDFVTFEGCFTIKLSAKIVVFYKNDTCRRIFYPIAAGPRTLPDGNPCKSRAPQGGIRQNPARIPQVCDRSPKSSANENGINGQPAMFHRKQSAGTRQKDKFRHRKAIRRIVSRPRNLKFPGGHDAFTNYFAKFVTL